MKTFTMNDLSKLVEIIGSSSESDDRLPAFLKKFNFLDKYETDDDSIVYVTGNNKGLEIEFSILSPFIIELFPSCIVKRLKAVSLFWNGRI